MGDNVAGEVRMFIDADGNVGIGTTEPGEKLDIEVSGPAGSTVSTTNLNGIEITDPDTAGSYRNLGIKLGTGAGEYAFFAAQRTSTGDMDAVIGANDAEVVRVTGAGDVGIGTKGPQAKLHVNGTIFASAGSCCTSDIRL